MLGSRVDGMVGIRGVWGAAIAAERGNGGKSGAAFCAGPASAGTPTDHDDVDGGAESGGESGIGGCKLSGGAAGGTVNAGSSGTDGGTENGGGSGMDGGNTVRGRVGTEAYP